MFKLFKKETEADKLRDEIKRLAFKRESVMKTLKAERDEHEKNRLAQFSFIGTTAYEMHKEGNEDYDFSAFFERIKNFESLIETTFVKEREMSERYDEEEELLHASLALAEKAEAEEHIPSALEEDVNAKIEKSCSGCGLPVSENEEICKNCLAKV